MTDYEAAKVTELRQLAKDQGLKYSGLKKNALVKLLQANEGNVSTATGEGDSSGHCATDTAVKNGDAGQASGTDSQIASATATDLRLQEQLASTSSDVQQDENTSYKSAEPTKSSDVTAQEEPTLTEKLIDIVQNPETAAPMQLPFTQHDASHVEADTAARQADPERDNAEPGNNPHKALKGTGSENKMQGNVPAGAEIKESERVVESEAMPEKSKPASPQAGRTLPGSAGSTHDEALLTGESVTEVPVEFEANDAEGLHKRRVEEEQDADDRVAKKLRNELGVEPIGGSAMV